VARLLERPHESSIKSRPMSSVRYVVITPVRNEAAFVDRTIESMAAQTLRPQQWVIVDDGSTDGTSRILETAAGQHAWVTVVTRADRGSRKSGGGVVEAFYDGYSALDQASWDFLVKLDGDLTFGSDYFARCLAHFDQDPRLGIGGGTVCVVDGGQTRIDSPGDPPFHVRGATKIYRHACWDQISPLVRAPGWDTIDEVKANMHGWHTRTFPELTVMQQRATGGVDGAWRNWFKNGVANYVTGYHPAFMLAKCVRRSWARPRVVAAIALWSGFCWGYVKRQPRVDDVFALRYLRRQQLLRLMSRPSIYGVGIREPRQ
jgi:poly-beta-1,6-N-acetyl-D-glucosamine synthase